MNTINQKQSSQHDHCGYQPYNEQQKTFIQAYLKIISAIDQGLRKKTHFQLTMRVV